MELVLPVRKGGLGNQLFQVAAAMVYGFETGRTVILPRAQKHIHVVHPYLYEESILSGFPILDRVIDEPAISSLQNDFSLHPGEPAFESWKPIQSKGNILLHGYFQYYPALEPYREKIAEKFLSGLKKYLCAPSHAVGIHVRRGDYLQFADTYPTLGPSYYLRAIACFPKDTHFKIFSDDISWCKEMDMFQSCKNVTFVEEMDEIKSLCEMIACEGGFITANSSFSWWGAFLGAYRKGARCVTPESWFKEEVTTLVPSDWIRIPSAKGSLRFFEPGTLDCRGKKEGENIILPLSKTIEVYSDCPLIEDTPHYKIFLQMEPLAIKNVEEFVIGNAMNYDKIFTFNQTILDKCPNAVKCILPACSWVSGTHYHKIDTRKKQFKISCITGSKLMAEGHSFRLLLYYNQHALKNECHLPITFYRSSAGDPLPALGDNPFLFNDKFPLFETFQYSLVIENSSQPNYFTEKLIDCLITKTIPIYYGCPNISEYFDTTGWILLTDPTPEGRLNECIHKWIRANYTADSYQSFSQTIEKNYDTCKEKYPGFYNTFNKLFLEMKEFS